MPPSGVDGGPGRRAARLDVRRTPAFGGLIPRGWGRPAPRRPQWAEAGSSLERGLPSAFLGPSAGSRGRRGRRTRPLGRQRPGRRTPGGSEGPEGRRRVSVTALARRWAFAAPPEPRRPVILQLPRGWASGGAAEGRSPVAARTPAAGCTGLYPSS